MNALIATIPHAGEAVPDECEWLQSLSEPVLMCDVDRFVDKLYEGTLQELEIPWVGTKWHRYAADLNRDPNEFDCDAVEGSSNASGKHNRGFHWTVTTTGLPLMTKPMSRETHEKLVKMIHGPFHQEVESLVSAQRKAGKKTIFHLDLHSMPSVGTALHKDPGEHRADIVVSDQNGASSSMMFVDLVIASYVKAGFKVGYNWPYLGGKVVQMYGKPKEGHHAVQVEISRSLYMNEVTKKFSAESAKVTMAKLRHSVQMIQRQIISAATSGF